MLAKNGDDIFCSDDKASRKSTHLFIAPPARLALKSGGAVRPLWYTRQLTTQVLGGTAGSSETRALV